MRRNSLPFRFRSLARLPSLSMAYLKAVISQEMTLPGTYVIISKIFSQKKLTFLAQNIAKLYKILIITLFFLEKR
jgi:hypothetical protein